MRKVASDSGWGFVLAHQFFTCRAPHKLSHVTAKQKHLRPNIFLQKSPNTFKAKLGSFLISVCHVDSALDLSEPVHAWAVVGGLVPQPPARSGSAVAAGHRLPDGPSAEAAGFKQRLPALPGHHLRYVPAFIFSMGLYRWDRLGKFSFNTSSTGSCENRKQTLNLSNERKWNCIAESMKQEMKRIHLR